MTDVERMFVVKVEPGDVLVFTTPRHLTPSEAAQIKKKFAEYVADNKCIVIGDGATLQVLRPDSELRLDTSEGTKVNLDHLEECVRVAQGDG